jgi:cobalt-zinc-cadmium efflux system membrane fusion protein
MRIERLSLPAMALCLVHASCHTTQAAAEVGGKAPPGQVWLTPAEEAQANVRTAVVELQNVDDSLLTSGTIALDDLHLGRVFSPINGRVTKILATPGARVKKGEALASIESPDVGSAVSDVHKAEADLITAEHTLKRKKDLAADQAASEADVEQAEDAARNARAELERARQKQFLLHVGHVDAVTQSYILTSPIDGEVLARNISPGMEVQGQYSGGGAAQELFTVGELDDVWVLGDVYEIDLARVHVGAPAEVTVVAYPDKVFKGAVDWVSGSLDPTTRTAKVRCTFQNPDRLLRPMMYSTVRISVDQKKAIAIPRSAVVRLAEYKVVFIDLGEAEGRVRFERVPIDVAETGSTQWLEVRHGLEVGQKVVVAGADGLSQRL